MERINGAIGGGWRVLDGLVSICATSLASIGWEICTINPYRVSSVGLLDKYREEIPSGARIYRAPCVLLCFTYTPYGHGGRWIALGNHDHPKACEDLGF